MHGSIYKRAADGLAAIEFASELRAFLDRLDQLNSLIEGKLKSLANLNESSRTVSEANEIKSISILLPNLTAHTNLRALFREIEVLTETLSHTFSETEDPQVIIEFVQQLNEIADLYNSFVQSPKPEISLKLLNRGRTTQMALSSLSGFFSYLIANSQDTTPQEGEAEFSLDLSYTADLDDFSRRLVAISIIYKELSELLGESTAPLKIAKIESGSLLTKLVGDTKVVGLLVDVMRGATHYFHRNVTSEGKIASIAPKVDAVEKILGLSKKLAEAGVDVGSLNEQLGKSAHSIAHQLNTLLADQPVVSINGEDISLEGSMAKIMLQNNQSQRIGFERELKIDPTWDDEPPPLGLPGPG